LLGAATASIAAGSVSPTACAQELPVSTREMWGWVRAQQVLDPGITYLDTAGIGPGLRAAMGAEYRHQETFNGDIANYQHTLLSSTSVGNLLQRLGTLLDCDRSELTITQGATEALAMVAQGLDFSTGDEIIVTTHAHNAAIYPWLMRAQRQGWIVKQVTLPSPLLGTEQPLGLIASAITERTRAIVVSHVQHTDGAILPVTEICAFAKQRNLLSIIDGAQACGSVDISVRTMGCDFYATSLHKWLNAPHGLGLLYIRKELLDRVWPYTADSNAGWSPIDRHGQAAFDAGEGFDDVQRATWPATLQKFGNSIRFLGPRLRALQAALDFRDQLGADRIEARIRELAIYARLRLQQISGVEILTPAPPGMWGGILAFRPREGTAKALAERLTRTDRVVVASVTHAAGPQSPAFESVRASFHIYNSHDDVERLLRGVQKYL
jgi:selenocysteine lyase/cysteine desulfurase